MTNTQGGGSSVTGTQLSEAPVAWLGAAPENKGPVQRRERLDHDPPSQNRAAGWSVGGTGLWPHRGTGHKAAAGRSCSQEPDTAVAGRGDKDGQVPLRSHTSWGTWGHAEAQGEGEDGACPWGAGAG